MIIDPSGIGFVLAVAEKDFVFKFLTVYAVNDKILFICLHLQKVASFLCSTIALIKSM